MEAARLAPVTRLPSELLARIFKYLQSQPLPLEYHSSLSGHIHQWHVVLRVCRLWRYVALENPELWNTIFIGQPWPQKAFHHRERFKELPLNIVYDVTSNDSTKEDEMLHALWKHVEPVGGVRQLVLRCGNRRPKIWESVIQIASNLQSLVIIAHPRAFEFNEDDDFLLQMPTLPHDTFPNLTRLLITGVSR
ncbi:hypothetical protein D9756_007992 [Leucocoprinus leucothites]|uniref:F-box domain-containing protein n=1 Tax=Leucocoprinus leucothites TaxID=201217 RepID=A0A8H5D5A1_9AGAR|nr:hypothetical protein D9756_007992 [Leucoagaricus leucothites]